MQYTRTHFWQCMYMHVAPGLPGVTMCADLLARLNSRVTVGASSRHSHLERVPPLPFALSDLRSESSSVSFVAYVNLQAYQAEPIDQGTKTTVAITERFTQQGGKL